MKIKYCKKCEEDTERNANSGKCIACVKATGAKYRIANPDKKAAYRAANTDKAKTYNAAYYAKNMAKTKASIASYRADNPEMVRSANAKWKKANPEKVRIQWHNRNARKLANGGKLSTGLAERLFKLQRGKCPCCAKPLGDNYNLDHIMPLSLGGANEDWNIQLLRQQCNNWKSAKHPNDFMQLRGFLL